MPLDGSQVRIAFPPAFAKLAPNFMPDGRPVRYKAAHGGRGGAKSQSFARLAIAESMAQRHLYLCTRQYQNSIRDSVHRLLKSQVYELNLEREFDIGEKAIRNYRTGSEFIFKGLEKNIEEIKSMHGVTRCWMEEAQFVKKASLRILDPTIRTPGSQIWASFNPVDPEDAIYDEMVTNTPPDALVLKIGWRDNPWFPAELERLRQRALETDADAYDWIWEGECRRISNAAVFKDRYVVEGFDTSERDCHFLYGLDFGFANDPTAGIRCFIKDDCLYVDYEVFGWHIEIDEIPALLEGGIKSVKTSAEFSGLPDIKKWVVKADAARPETISFIRRQGFNVSAAEKWPGSVEDGIAHLKGFKRLIVHPRCINLAQEFRLYSFKTDERTDPPTVLPLLIDKHNHGIDALRYALDGYIQHRGGLGVWKKLVR